MANITECKRLSKRIMLTNLLTNDYSIALTPLLSGKHGIGKSQVAKQIAKDLDGICITIEGGTLKEGEITGIPYQYRNENDEIQFKFLPYYVVDRIQKAEKTLNKEMKAEENLDIILNGDENQYSVNDLSFEEKIDLITTKKVKPVIIFFDEINRTDNAVFRELMNIILTRTINGYRLPWWVFIIAAMNPSTQNSMYATNEIDPAQLDRFIKIKTHEDAEEWIEYAVENNYDKTIIEFIANNQEALSEQSKELDDDEKATPSPRGWSMLNLIIEGKNKLDMFFTKDELKEIDKDIRNIISAKVGSVASSMYYTSLRERSRLVLAKDIFDFDTDNLSTSLIEIIKEQSTARNSITSKSIVKYLKDNIDILKTDNRKMMAINTKLSTYIKLLDSSSKVLFARNLTSETSVRGTEVFDYVTDIVDDELLELLQVSNVNEMKIIREN